MVQGFLLVKFHRVVDVENCEHLTHFLFAFWTKLKIIIEFILPKHWMTIPFYLKLKLLA